MASGNYDSGSEIYPYSFTSGTKAVVISNILLRRGSITDRTRKAIIKYISSGGDHKIMEDARQLGASMGMDTTAYCDLLYREDFSNKVESMIHNRIMPLAKKSSLLGLLSSFKKLSGNKKETILRREVKQL